MQCQLSPSPRQDHITLLTQKALSYLRSEQISVKKWGERFSKDDWVVLFFIDINRITSETILMATWHTSGYLKGEVCATGCMCRIKWENTDNRWANCPLVAALPDHAWAPGCLCILGSQKILLFPYSNWIKGGVKLQMAILEILWPKVKTARCRVSLSGATLLWEQTISQLLLVTFWI